MNKNTLTALLDDLRALILKSRPAYRDFLGEVTEAKTTKILENVVLAENKMILPVADAAFSGFIAGEAYRVVLNGEEKSVVAKEPGDIVILSNVEDLSNLPNDFWAIGYDFIEGKMIANASGTFLGATISVYYDETVTTQKWSVKKLAYELLPDRLLSALSAAANTARKALTAANDAQSTANAAQSTANTASSQLSKMATKTDPVFTGTFSQNRKIGSTSGAYSHAEGSLATASGNCSHAEGLSSSAQGESSHAEGSHTIASGEHSHVQGKFNVEDSQSKYAHIVGNGTDESARSNAHTLDWDGNAWFAGNVYVGGSDQSSGEKLATRNELPKRPVAQLVTLSASEWNADTKTQTVTVFGVLADESAQLVTSTPLTTSARAYNNAGVALTGREENMVTFTAEMIPTEDIKLYVVRQEIVLLDYLAFSSPEPFSIAVSNPGWDGTMEYFTDATSWTTWAGESISAAEKNGKYSLYLRGTGNTVVTGNNNNVWSLTGSNISCTGNIETLLDYITVAARRHPTMADGCYRNMFYGCTSIVTAPDLPATTLANYCYSNMFNGCTSLVTAPNLPATTLVVDCYGSMFRGCTSLVTAPDLPATTLANYCYSDMFYGCTSLVTAPDLPATTLAESCYSNMFRGCTSIVTAPDLPATTLAKYCYRNMFYGCTSIVTAPNLPATTLAESCYGSMFRGCTSIVTAPDLPVTTLAESCYGSMFYGCTSLVTAPNLPATTLAESCYGSMFNDCTSLVTAPNLPATTLANYCYSNMFYSCTSLVTAPNLPATTLAKYCYRNMFSGCTSLKLSSTQTEEYTIAYRIPANDVGTTATDAMTDMFVNTGGTFTGTPVINTTYYLHKDNSIVQ